MSGIEDAVIDAIKHLEGADDRAGRQQLELQAATRHFFHALDVLPGKIHPDVGGWPGCLHLDGDGALRGATAGAASVPAAAAPATVEVARKRRREIDFSVI